LKIPENCKNCRKIQNSLKIDISQKFKNFRKIEKFLKNLKIPEN